MKYNSGAQFRRALEDRLRTRNLQTGMPLIRLRKMVAFDRFLARLVVCQPDKWLLKGGFALQLRLGEKVRTTKDIDMLALMPTQDVYPLLRQAGLIDLGDWFLYEVAHSEENNTDDFGGLRFPVRSLLAGRVFEIFHIDVGINDPVVDAPDMLSTPGLLQFADIPPTLIPCYPLTQQIAEKMHAYTRPHPSGESSRVKDFIDLLLIARLGEIEGRNLAQALNATFAGRSTHHLPARIPDPPGDWEQSFKKLANEVELGFATIKDATRALEQFLNPVLAGNADQKWDPIDWGWR